jgi:hypothetical protein
MGRDGVGFFACKMVQQTDRLAHMRAYAIDGWNEYENQYLCLCAQGDHSNPFASGGMEARREGGSAEPGLLQ